MSAANHILVVEDETHLALGIKFNLEAEGFRVSTFADGGSALDAIHDDPDNIDLMILDLMLPGMSGYTVCERLREEGHTFPILILSARTLPEDRTRGFDAGANQYLSKPFDLDELLSRVRNLLTHYRRDADDSPPLEQFEFADVKIDFRTFEVTVGGQPVRMTQLEMKLLQYFIQNEGRVIPRQELLEKVWGLPGQVQTRAPDQFIRRLRKAFEPKPASPQHFLTIRDAGYRFVARHAGVEADEPV